MRDLRRRRSSEPTPSGLNIFRSPLWLPRFFRTKLLDDLVRAAQLRSALRQLSSHGCSKVVLSIWRPEFLFELNQAGADFTVFHVDDEYSFTDDAPDVADERLMLSSVNQVIVHSAVLMEKKSPANPHTLMLSNGVDFAAYSTSYPEPPDLEAIAHPRIGYSGFLKRQLDWRLMAQLAERHPDWSFVFVGATRSHDELRDSIQQLSKRSNCHFLGAKTTREMARYAQHFDCCLMPYMATNYTNAIYPMKLHEYLASGRPVVGTSIGTLKAFGATIELASSIDEWSAAIARSLAPAANTRERRLERQGLARQHDWNNLVYRVAATIAGGLGEQLPAEPGSDPGVGGPAASENATSRSARAAYAEQAPPG